jgi:predicted alpha/beta-hydrolase family hydrolase
MELIFNGPVDGPLFVFAHGAGAPATSDFMEIIATGLAAQGIRVARFNFPYMQQRVDKGTRRPPERAPKLIEQYQMLIGGIDQPMVIGGKSMGGRIASMVAASISAESQESDSKVKGVVCLGFPFHPANKPEKLRTKHLPLIRQALFIAQGERDKMGTKEEILSYSLPENINWLWLEDGDHDLKPRIKSGFTHQTHLQRTIIAMSEFIKQAVLT